MVAFRKLFPALAVLTLICGMYTSLTAADDNIALNTYTPHFAIFSNGSSPASAPSFAAPVTSSVKMSETGAQLLETLKQGFAHVTPVDHSVCLTLPDLSIGIVPLELLTVTTSPVQLASGPTMPPGPWDEKPIALAGRQGPITELIPSQARAA